MTSIKSVFFRADSSNQIGSGHVMRCLTLALGLKAIGIDCHFVSRPHPGNHLAYIESLGFKIHTLKKPITPLSYANYGDWVGASQENDAKEFIEHLPKAGCDWVIVDHYGLDHKWEKAVKKYTRAIMVIDDLANRPHTCELLLDQNYYLDMHSRYISLVEENTNQLIGPNYALVRDEFKDYRPSKLKMKTRIQNLMVYFGATDPLQLTLPALEIIQEYKNFGVTVILGNNAPHFQHVQTLCKQQGFQHHMHVTQFAKLMSQSDLAIGAGGSTNWERFCLGLPAIVTAVAENQIESVKTLSDSGLIFLCPDQSYKSELRNLLNKLLTKPKLHYSTSKKGYNLVDGNGTNRVIQEILNVFG
ncbi:MAG: UDP-2,4-diacetamido-2,4,6-trideoxy-beta-L-altropyranose hydrolase [Candidatus Margulisiibacteriota bacterium]